MANVDIRLGHKDTAWFTANPTLVLKDGQMVVCSDGGNIGKYKIGDGTTQLSALTFYGGLVSTPTFQQTLTAGSILTGSNTILPSVSGSYDLIFGNNTSQFKTFRTDTSQYNEIFARKTATSSVSYFYNEGDEIDIGIDNGTNINSLSITGFGLPASDGSLLNRFLLTDDIGLKGLVGAGYYGANYTDNTYVQKKWVTTNFQPVGSYLTTISGLNISLLTNDSGYITSSALSPYLTSASAALTYEPIFSKNTAFNKNFGTGTTNIVEIGSTLGNSLLTSTDANGKLQTLTTTTYPSLTEISYVKGVTSAIQTQINNKYDSSNPSGYITSNALSPYLTSASAALTYQPLDADLTSWASVTRAANFDTFVATPSSANFAALITDETGSGKVVFDTAPTFQTSVNAAYATASTIASFDGSKNLVSLATSTYPSLTELSYVKGVTSAVQTQLDGKVFTIQCQMAANGNLIANLTRYFSNLYQESTSGLRSTAGQVLVGIPYNCTLVGATVNTWTSSANTSQTASTLYFRKNGVDNLITSNLLWASTATSNILNVTNLNVSCTAGDTFEMKVITGNLAVVPSTPIISVFLYFRV